MTTCWICPHCTLENYDSNSHCEVCQQKRPDSNIPPPTDTDNKQNDNNNKNNNKPKNQWQCERCTLFNQLSDSICTTCGEAKPSPNKDNNNEKKDNNNYWKCPTCTFSNKPTIIQCSMCNVIKSNTKHKKNVKTTFVWEWKGGNTWHEYSDDISNKIQTSYNNGIIKIDLDLSHAKYIIDLSKLQQINTESQKGRKIRCVKYEESIDDTTTTDITNTNMSNKIDIDEDTQSDIDIEMANNENKSDDLWQCNQCTLKNLSSNTHCEMCKNERPKTDQISHDKQEKSPSLNLKDLSLEKQTTKTNLMNLSSDEEDNTVSKKQKKKKTKTKKAKKKNNKNSNQPTMLNIFQKEEHIPKPLGKLKKKKKRKLSEIIGADESDLTDTSPQKKKQKKTDISAKYSNKYSGGVLNKDLIDALWELSMIERNSGNKFKANAYSKACKGLKECGVQITSGKQAQDMLKGVGKKIAAKIDELLATGHLKKLDNLRADDNIQAINQLCQIHGIGPKKAAELVKQHGIMSIEELRRDGKHMLNTQQKIGLKYFEYINKRIPREQCTKIGDIVRGVLDGIDQDIIMDICGSYRRGKKDCGDVDILLTHKDKKYDEKRYSKKLLTDIVRKLKENRLLVEDLAFGPVKYMGICRYEETVSNRVTAPPNENGLPDSVPLNFTIDVPSFEDVDMDQDIILNEVKEDIDVSDNKKDSVVYGGYDDENGKRVYFRRIDLKFINYKFYYANLLYFTGSDRFNVDMRLKANEKELILNENGLYKMLDEDDHTKKSKDPVVQPTCEKDIFDVIGMDYVEPKGRSW